MGTSPKLADLAYYGQFSMLLLTDFGSRDDPNVQGTLWTAYGDLAKTRRFGPFLPIFYAIIHCFRCHGHPNVLGSPGSGYGDLAKTRRLVPFWSFFYAITH
jgi:hypothetical protein